MIAPGINGFQEDMNDRPAYDPDAAKSFLWRLDILTDSL